MAPSLPPARLTQLTGFRQGTFGGFFLWMWSLFHYIHGEMLNRSEANPCVRGLSCDHCSMTPVLCSSHIVEVLLRLFFAEPAGSTTASISQMRRLLHIKWHWATKVFLKRSVIQDSILIDYACANPYYVVSRKSEITFQPDLPVWVCNDISA